MFPVIPGAYACPIMYIMLNLSAGCFARLDVAPGARKLLVIKGMLLGKAFGRVALHANRVWLLVRYVVLFGQRHCWRPIEL